MTRQFAVAASLTLLTACTGTERVPSHGLCNAGETSWFLCRTAQQKTVSLCGSPPATLQYRFGSTGQIESRYPQSAAAGATRFFYAHYFRAQAERVEVTFQDQGIDYAIFDYTEGDQRRAGVRATRADGKETEVMCSADLKSRLADLKDVVPCDADNALNGSTCRSSTQR
jgi:hypothetical protein